MFVFDEPGTKVPTERVRVASSLILPSSISRLVLDSAGIVKVLSEGGERMIENPRELVSITSVFVLVSTATSTVTPKEDGEEKVELFAVLPSSLIVTFLSRTASILS